VATGTVSVRGLAELNRALRRTDREVRLGVRSELREVAEPVRSQAEALAGSEIRRIGPVWQRMRVGVTTNLVYVATKQRGVSGRGRGGRRRPNLAPLLMDRAMQPALDRNAGQIERDLGRTLDRIADNFSR